MQERFLAIDFETAAGRRDSACAVGIVLFENGETKLSTYSLIDPKIPEGEWDPYNVSVHGIRPEDVRGAPDFVSVWKQLSSEFTGIPLVAHNASFDMSVVRAELAKAAYQPTQPLVYTCSATLARKAWPDLVSVSLPVVCEFLDLPLDHHQAASDATACGEVALRAVNVLGAQSISDALNQVGRRWGEVRPDLSHSTGYIKSTSGGGGNLRAKDFAPAVDGDFDEEHPLFNRIVVFTGSLQSMTRREAFEALSAVGGIPGNNVTKKTNVLVVGDQDIQRLAQGETLSSKQRKAAEIRLSGGDIQVVGEMEFLQLL